MINFIVDLMIVVLGIVTVGCNGQLARKYMRHRSNKLSRAIAIQYSAEVSAGVSTLAFAICSLFGLYGALDPFLVECLRLGVFGPSLISSINMHRVYEDIINAD